MGTPKPDASTPRLDDLDAGWEDEDDLDEPEAEEPEEPAPARMTPEEREARAARAASKKERARAKASAKKDRQRARALAAGGKQKQKQRRSKRPDARRDAASEPRTLEGRSSPARDLRARADHAEEGDGADDDDRVRFDRAQRVRRDWLRMALLVAIIVLVGAAGVFLLKK